MNTRPFLLLLFSLFVFANKAFAQAPPAAKSAQAAAPVVTVSATPSGVRFAALGSVKQTRLEVYDSAGAPVLDTGFLAGNVRDWQPQAGGLADGTYQCVLSARDLAGRLSLKQAAVLVAGGAASLSLGEAEASGGVSSVAQAGEPGAATLTTHDGKDGAVTATSGDLTLRTGDVLAGEDEERVRVTAEGKVGVGTSKPEAALDVAGEVRASQGFRFSDGSRLAVDEQGTLVRTDAAGAPMPALSAAGTGTLNRVAKWLETGGAGTLIDSAITESGGNVGLGTTTPVGSLSIGGSTKPTPMTMNYQYFSPNSIVDQGLIGWNYYWNGAALVRQNTAFTAIRFAANPANANANTSFFATMSNLAGADQTVFTATLDAAG
ncbi:MAG TPA: hypothetical protein VF064_07075, partial [Pyrinomonadaceae bacterium]